MKPKFSILLLLLLSFNSFTQTFAVKHGKRNRTCTIAQKYTDSIRLDVYTLNPDFTKHESSSLLLKNNSEIQRFASEKAHARMMSKTLLVIFSDSGGVTKPSKLQLSLVDSTLSVTLKKEAYYSQLHKRLEDLDDSLNCATSTESIALQFSDDRASGENISYAEYVSIVKHISDSLILAQQLKIQPTVEPYYNAINSMDKLNEQNVIELLNNADFNYPYSTKFLEALAQQQPDLLVHYIDLHTPQEKKVLKGIRKHEHYKEIVASIKASQSPNTLGKEEIIKQERKRNLKNTTLKVASVANIVAQVTLTVGVLIWIF